jgi:AraC-like DNA-binding protein
MLPKSPSPGNKTGLKELAAIHGGSLFVQYGHDALEPQNPPRHYWLIFDSSRDPAPNVIRTAARIERSWGMSLRLEKNPHYRRTLDSLSLTYILRGGGTFHDPSGARKVREGDLLVLVPGVPHAYGPAPGERWDEISVFFSGPVFEAWRRPGLLDPARPVRHLEPVDYWLERFHEVLLPLARAEAGQTPQDWGRLVDLIAEMCTAWQKSARNPDADWLERARHRLRTLPPLRDIDWQAVGQDLGVSERTFRRRFRSLAGMTPSAYRIRCRIEQARRLLLQSETKVSEVALALQFVNEFHFSRRFKQVTGLSPRAYRESHRNR